MAERQAALAGYRLADEIQKYLKCGSVAPLLPENTDNAPQTVLPKKIGTAQAKNYDDETMVVTGRVTITSVPFAVEFKHIIITRRPGERGW
jgi:hypothetical protein